MPLPSSSRMPDDVVAPTQADPLMRSASPVVGGPIGRHARSGRSRFSVLTVVLLIGTGMFALGLVQKAPCVIQANTVHETPYAFSHMCYSDIVPLYVGRGLAEGIVPYTDVSTLPSSRLPADPQEITPEYPVLTGAWMGLTGWVTHLVGADPDLTGVSYDEVPSVPGIAHDTVVFWAVNAVGFAIVFLIALALLVRAQPRRPWDAAMLAAAPVVALNATINWDMLALGFVTGFIWAWARGRPIWAGVMIGLGTATKLYPIFFLGPLLILCLRERRLQTWVTTCASALVAWLVVDAPVFLWSPTAFLKFWRFNAERGAEFGSGWDAAAQFTGTAGHQTINVTMLAVFGAACLGVAALAWMAPRRPRLPQLLFLLVAAFLLVNKVYSPQYVLWLLPLAVLAHPRWRDILIWQATETLYFFAIWMHIAGFLAAEGQPDHLYALFIAIRIAGELYLVVMVLRDIFVPWLDPVRADGLSDDPLGGVLDEGIDFETLPHRELTAPSPSPA